MQILPIKTPVLQPPEDDLLAALTDSITDLQNGDVVAISSKVVAIDEGRCIPVEDIDKTVLVESMADITIPRDYWKSPLTIVHSAFIGTAGIDESNADGYYVLLPEKPVMSAKRIHAHLCATYGVSELGVTITDSHSIPLRRGAIGISIGFWGFVPIIDHVGEQDLFGRELKIEVSNLVDGLAAAANVVMGETDAAQPVAILRDVPNITFSTQNHHTDVYIKPAEDTFRVLYERFINQD